MVIDKPTGISSHGAFPGDLGVAEWWRLYHDDEIHVVSRLDKGTSGVLLLARHARAAARAQIIHEAGTALKEYVFLSAADSQAGGLGANWQKDSPVAGKRAKTRFTKLGRHGDYFLYAATLTRGRMHQVRRHARESGVAILGDTTYGGKVFPRLCLHCHKLCWPGIAAEIASPLPESFTDTVWTLRDPSFLAALDRRRGIYDGITDAIRLVTRGEMAGLDCAIERYGDFLSILVYDKTIADQDIVTVLDPYIEKLTRVLGLRGGAIKRVVTGARGEGGATLTRVFGEPPPETIEVSERGLSFEISPQQRHTGLFLDQRDNRARVARLARGRRIANLFCYTGSFSVAAASAGCEVVFSVDTAGSALTRAKRNFARNGLDMGRGKFIRDDALAWLARQGRKMTKEKDGARFDVIVCDPPTFATAKKGRRFSVEKQWRDLALACRAIAADGATAFFSTNHHGAERAGYESALTSVFTAVQDLVSPLDFPRLPGAVQGLKLFLCRP